MTIDSRRAFGLNIETHRGVGIYANYDLAPATRWLVAGAFRWQSAARFCIFLVEVPQPAVYPPRRSWNVHLDFPYWE